MRKIIFVLATFALLVFVACTNPSNKSNKGAVLQETKVDTLRNLLADIAGKYPGEIGIAVITDGDTIAVNDEVKYPLMSVFKLHQAIALCDMLEKQGRSLDSIVKINVSDLNAETWSPMLKDYTEDVIEIPIRELLRYTLMQSDNNASNYMFENLCSVEETDSFIATLIPRDGFKLIVSEADMWSDHKRCYENRTSPLSAAILINRLFTDSTVCDAHRNFICNTLRECQTGKDRIAAPLLGETGVTVAHKTGSGFKDNGILAAHNDVGYITLPDGRSYSLAVFVKDYHGDEAQAAETIAEISAAVYNTFKQ